MVEFAAFVCLWRPPTSSRFRFPSSMRTFQHHNASVSQKKPAIDFFQPRDAYPSLSHHTSRDSQGYNFPRYASLTSSSKPYLLTSTPALLETKTLNTSEQPKTQNAKPKKHPSRLNHDAVLIYHTKFHKSLHDWSCLEGVHRIPKVACRAALKDMEACCRTPIVSFPYI